MGSRISWAEVVEVVKKLLSGKGLGVDEICPEFPRFKGGTRGCFPMITLLGLPGNVNSGVQEGRIR